MSKEGFGKFKEYVTYLEQLASKLCISQEIGSANEAVEAALDGQVGERLRFEVPITTRRVTGAFFTSSKLAQKAFLQAWVNEETIPIYADPTCGGGDLLLACARHLPLSSSLHNTLVLWGKHLYGLDINSEFIRTSKARLILLAIHRLSNNGCRLLGINGITEYFPMIKRGDFLESPHVIEKATHILINPPYNETRINGQFAWGTGRVSFASVFLCHCLNHARPNTTIVAILPDVLRSGSRYQKWRDSVQSLSDSVTVSTHGQFDRWTDIDVFILRLIRTSTHEGGHVDWQGISTIAGTHKCVGDICEVHVGPVVPHRHREVGPNVAYIHAKPMQPWAVVKRIAEKRRFQGTLFLPPFVVVRRTSRPGDKRAIGTIIVGERKVAVENHLIVLLPSNGELKVCEDLLAILKNPRTDAWLDSRIRCRHLTVGAVRQIPWWR